MAGYTKGEWKFNGRDIVVGQNIGQQRICTIIEHREEYKAEDEANARLILAAPDLLNACVGLLGAMHPALQKKWPNNTKRAQKAIAKAEKPQQ